MNLKSQKGSITLFVLVSCLFFLASVACVNMYMQSKQTAVDREYRQVKANYEKDINNMETIYNDLASKNNLSVQFGVPEIDKENKKINVSVFTNLEYLNIGTIKYGWKYDNDLSTLSTKNIPDWTFVEHQNGENEFIASIDLKKYVNDEEDETDDVDIVYYYLGVVVDKREFGTTVSYYVDDGMILHYDGINNVGLGDKKHSLNATTWKNLCENVTGHDGVLSTTGITWGNDYLNFDGNDWVNAGVIDSDSQSIEAVFSANQYKTAIRCVLGDWESAGGGISIDAKNVIVGNFHINGSYVYLPTVADRNNNDYIESNKYIPEKKYNITLTYDGEYMIYYINGVEKGKTDRIQGKIAMNNTTVMALGANPKRDYAESEFLNGKIYSARVYTRALSANEVKQNYITDKSRFNIED